jgi:hypothetical protein
MFTTNIHATSFRAERYEDGRGVFAAPAGTDAP